jgi:hypothetical protein
VVGLRDGLKELGYRENQDFVIGVRFTQVISLPSSLHENPWRRADIFHRQPRAGQGAAAQPYPDRLTAPEIPSGWD